MSDVGLLDKRLSDVELLLRRLTVDPVTRRVYLSNIVDFKKAKDLQEPADKSLEEATAEDFEAIQERNRKLKEKREKERLEKNKQVLNNYRIKQKGK